MNLYNRKRVSLLTIAKEDKESGLLYYKSRYYDPMLSRFLQADSEADIDEVSGMNRYMYVDGNPVSYVDPTGHCAARSTFAVLYQISGGPLNPIQILAAAGGVYGNYTGNGNCGMSIVMSKQVQSAFVFLMLNTSNSNELLLYYYYVKYYKPKNVYPLTEVDKASAEHDRKDEGSRWTSSTSTQGNNKWIRRNSSLFIGGGLLPIPTQRMWDKTYSRENDALYRKDIWGRRTSGKYGSLTKTVATINTVATIYGDWQATLTGTVLFGVANIVNYRLMYLGKRTGIHKIFK